jgi:hypothetical protein
MPELMPNSLRCWQPRWISSIKLLDVERDAEERLLLLAAEKRIAVLVNRPFAESAV